MIGPIRLCCKMLFRKICKLSDVTPQVEILSEWCKWHKYASLRHSHCPSPPRLQLRPKGLLQPDLRWFLETSANRMEGHHTVAGINTSKANSWHRFVYCSSGGELSDMIWNGIRAEHSALYQHELSKTKHRRPSASNSITVQPSKSCSSARDSGVWMSELGHRKAEDVRLLRLHDTAWPVCTANSSEFSQ